MPPPSNTTNYNPSIIISDSTSNSEHDVIIQSITPTPNTNVDSGTTIPTIKTTFENLSTNRPRRKAATLSWQQGPVKFRDQQQHDIILPNYMQEVNAYRMSLNKALKQTDRIDSILHAIEDEIDNMERGKVMPPVHYRDIPLNYRDKIIPLHMFLKDKYLSTGEYDKTKARLTCS